MANRLYQNRMLYTSSINQPSEKDLDKSYKGKAKIEDAYFFEKIENGKIVRRYFDKDKITSHESNNGLNISVLSEKAGFSCLTITGLESICSFLSETNCLGRDLSFLRGKEVTMYSDGIRLFGLSPQEDK
ncbi:MAG: hypothetical protein WC867_03685 [Candidatus Pacearchaeota archaeon]|jgi:hypothetical protein